VDFVAVGLLSCNAIKASKCWPFCIMFWMFVGMCLGRLCSM
jgi:hypothetical protein